MLATGRGQVALQAWLGESGSFADETAEFMMMTTPEYRGMLLIPPLASQSAGSPSPRTPRPTCHRR
jgi:hypothetical protein